MITVVVVLALLALAVCAGELVRGQCRRMLRSPRPSAVAARGDSAPADAISSGDSVQA